jgi:prepilin-type N-terminal cleavage/methylation domain-containing protein
MIRLLSKKKFQRGVSIIEIMIVLVLISIIMGGMFMILNRTNRQLRSQSMVADIQTVGSIAFFLIGRDIRRAGSNPAGALGYDVGAPIPFGFAESERIQIYADLNGDGDVTDEEEDIVYEYIDNEAGIDGSDTIRRTAGGNETFITNVYDFELQYIMSNGVYTATPTPYSDIRMVVIKFEVGTDQRDMTTGQIILRSFETTVGLRNYQ